MYSLDSFLSHLKSSINVAIKTILGNSICKYYSEIVLIEKPHFKCNIYLLSLVALLYTAYMLDVTVLISIIKFILIVVAGFEFH